MKRVRHAQRAVTRWAACRKPDILYKTRAIWRVPHDGQRGVLTQYWYTEAGPTSLDGFDVRALPGYEEQKLDITRGLADFSKQLEHEQAYHVEVIKRAIDAGCDLIALSQQRTAEIASRLNITRRPEDEDLDIPF